MRGLALALALLGCPAGGQADADPAVVACHAFTPGADYTDIMVVRQLEGGEVTLRVPAQYFEDFWDRVGGHRGTAQLFRVEIGSWEPVTREETGTRNAAGVWNWMDVLVHDVISLERVAVVGANSYGPEDTPVTAFPPRLGPEELVWLDTPFASDKERPERDVFTHPTPPATIETVVVCASPANPIIRTPTCNQHFRAAGLDVQLLYDRIELPR
ncbi:hypothetical protein FHG66_21135 [Rubellimicrobium rubrum]|uniref:Uncharacterized protein n=1 Tax=Rubellimicrobium rubrum TaxID=2585369 RepID=A0A5C4MKB0_9RHOB|nr:hypothetical protein FHG66_21135 [Rubellimicrobium rubrum]